MEGSGVVWGRMRGREVRVSDACGNDLHDGRDGDAAPATSAPPTPTSKHTFKWQLTPEGQLTNTYLEAGQTPPSSPIQPPFNITNQITFSIFTDYK